MDLETGLTNVNGVTDVADVKISHRGYLSVLSFLNVSFPTVLVW